MLLLEVWTGAPATCRSKLPRACHDEGFERRKHAVRAVEAQQASSQRSQPNPTRRPDGRLISASCNLVGQEVLDYILHERAPNFDAGLLTQYLPGYTLQGVQSDADPDRPLQMSQRLFGWPACRPRSYAVLTRNSSGCPTAPSLLSPSHPRSTRRRPYDKKLRRERASKSSFCASRTRTQTRSSAMRSWNRSTWTFKGRYSSNIFP